MNVIKTERLSCMAPILQALEENKKNIRFIGKAIPVAARPMAWFCGRWLTGIAGSNPVGGIDVCLLRILCFVSATG